MIYRIKPLFPLPVWRAITAPYWWWYNRARHQAAAVVDGRLRRSRRRLAQIQNSHSGGRCFILGNGPSLAGMDLTPLKSELTFGLNRAYLLFPKLGFSTTYFVAVNTLVVEQCAEEIKRLKVPKFITWRARHSLRGDDQVTFLDTDYTGAVSFSADVTGRVFEGSTVTYVALQLAYHLG
ncbi:MAG: 6-hydroxymethylpterin diphosphokinase MptE-like protein, partial [Anaerolineales bacterium]